MVVLTALGWWVLVYYVSQVAFIIVLHGLICAVFQVNLFQILGFIKDEIVIVLGTASSESVLPRLLEKLPALGVSRQTTGLVLPTGYVFNLGGAAIYLSMGVIFLSNAYNVHLSWVQLASILGLMLLTSKGVATVAGGSFVTFAATATATGILPLEGLPLMFGVYRLMAPANSTCNAVSNAIATVIIAKICGEYDPPKDLSLAAA
jgi:aerobic C4-dicarboxylate transport protein